MASNSSQYWAADFPVLSSWYVSAPLSIRNLTLGKDLAMTATIKGVCSFAGVVISLTSALLTIYFLMTLTFDVLAAVNIF